MDFLSFKEKMVSFLLSVDKYDMSILLERGSLLPPTL